MENRDKPIYPTTTIETSVKEDQKGLTKREYLSVLALQGLVSNTPLYTGYNDAEIAAICVEAVKFADALLARIDATA